MRMNLTVSRYGNTLSINEIVTVFIDRLLHATSFNAVSYHKTHSQLPYLEMVYSISRGSSVSRAMKLEYDVAAKPTMLKTDQESTDFSSSSEFDQFEGQAPCRENSINLTAESHRLFIDALTNVPSLVKQVDVGTQENSKTLLQRGPKLSDDASTKLRFL